MKQIAGRDSTSAMASISGILTALGLVEGRLPCSVLLL
jgi:hypothetical protein